MTNRTLTSRSAVVLGTCALAVLAVFLLPPLAQDPSYHLFADRRSVPGIQNWLNVLSNLAFLAAGLYGLAARGRKSAPLLAFSLGTVLTGIGSAYYHYAPSTQTLFWDRLPMTICFMSLSALVVGERVSERLGRALLWPLLAVGALSVVYWRLTESLGAGDLRPYVLVQFLPLLVLPLVCVLYPPRLPDGHCLRYAFWWYVAAKALELLDARIYSLGGIVSGHTLKHLASGYACWWVIRLSRRERTVQ